MSTHAHAHASAELVLSPAHDEIRVEYVALEALVRWERNPKDHDLGQLAGSIARFGFVAPLIVDEGTGRLVAGHGRLDALYALWRSGRYPPARVRVLPETGEWAVPVIRGVRFNSELEADAYGIADNRLVELGGWQLQKLGDVLQTLAASGDSGFSGTGYDADDLNTLLNDLQGATTTDPHARALDEDNEQDALDQADALLDTWHVQPWPAPGSLWRIPSKSAGGQRGINAAHLVLCGDSTDPEAVRALTGNQGVSLLATDPPYNVSKQYGDETDDDKPLQEHVAFLRAWWAAWRPHTARAVVTPGIRNLALWFSAGEEVPTHVGAWTKTNAMTNGRVSHFMTWEPLVFYGTGWPRERMTDLFDYAVPPQRAPGLGSLTPYHPCPKPLPLWEDLIRSYTSVGELVGDAFGGSGTTLAACELTGRLARLCEIEPKYVAVILERAKGLGLTPTEVT